MANDVKEEMADIRGRVLSNPGDDKFEKNEEDGCEPNPCSRSQTINPR
jgi:hypothetical protein